MHVILFNIVERVWIECVIYVSLCLGVGDCLRSGRCAHLAAAVWQLIFQKIVIPKNINNWHIMDVYTLNTHTHTHTRVHKNWYLYTYNGQPVWETKKIIIVKHLYCRSTAKREFFIIIYFLVVIPVEKTTARTI